MTQICSCRTQVHQHLRESLYVCVTQTVSNQTTACRDSDLQLQNPVTGPTAFESFQNANPIWQALNTAFLTVVSNTTSVSSTTLYFYQKIYGPLFEMFQQFPNGVFKGPMAGTPLTITIPAGESASLVTAQDWQSVTAQA